MPTTLRVSGGVVPADTGRGGEGPLQLHGPGGERQTGRQEGEEEGQERTGGRATAGWLPGLAFL